MNFLQKHRRIFKRLALITIFSSAIIIITILALKLSSVTSATTSAFCFLIVVLLSAFFGDLMVGTALSLLATVCFDYFFLPPVGKFTVAAFPDTIALVAFLLTSIIISRLTASAAENVSHAAKLKQTAANVELFGGWLVEASNEQLSLSQIAQHAVRFFSLEYCSIHVYAEGKWNHLTGTAKNDVQNEIEQFDVAHFRDHQSDINELADESFLGVQYAQVEAGRKPFALLAFKGALLPANTMSLIARMISLRLLQAG
jgi:two-component system, OmpR family, sensor histidine kinase KdpD